MSKGIRAPLGQAIALGDKLVDVLTSSCERIIIAGSVRREKEFVHDIEIVALPKEVTVRDLFGAHVDVGLTSLDTALNQNIDNLGWRIMGGGKKLKHLIHPNSGLKCDLTIVKDRRAWGSQVVVRTGPYTFSRHVMIRARDAGMFFSDGFLLHDHMPMQLKKPNKGKCKEGPTCPLIVPLNNESDVFEVLKIPYLNPQEREEKHGVG